MKKLLLCLLLGACRASVEASSGPQVPVFGGSHVRIEVSGGQASVPPSADLPEGTCVKLTFLDKDGKNLGSANVSAGGAGAPIPKGANSVLVSACDDPPKPKSPTNQVDQRQKGDQSFYAYRQLPISFEAGHLRYLEFLVQAPDKRAADDLALSFEADMLTQKCPDEVTPYGFLDVRLRQDGDFQLVTVTTKKPMHFRLDWNGIKLADLRDARVSHRRDWWAVAVTVPATLANLQKNEVHYQLDDTELTLELDL